MPVAVQVVPGAQRGADEPAVRRQPLQQLLARLLAVPAGAVPLAVEEALHRPDQRLVDRLQVPRQVLDGRLLARGGRADPGPRPTRAASAGPGSAGPVPGGPGGDGADRPQQGALDGAAVAREGGEERRVGRAAPGAAGSGAVGGEQAGAQGVPRGRERPPVETGRRAPRPTGAPAEESGRRAQALDEGAGGTPAERVQPGELRGVAGGHAGAHERLVQVSVDPGPPGVDGRRRGHAPPPPVPDPRSSGRTASASSAARAAVACPPRVDSASRRRKRRPGPPSGPQ